MAMNEEEEGRRGVGQTIMWTKKIPIVLGVLLWRATCRVSYLIQWTIS